MYFFARACVTNSDTRDAYLNGYFIRPLDWLPAFVMLVQNWACIMLFTIVTAEFAEEALVGLDILRKKSLLNRNNDHEMYFLMTINTGFSAFKRVEYYGGHFFYVNKEMCVTILSTTLSYFIIIYQFQPILDHQTFGNSSLRETYGVWMETLEDLPEHHWYHFIPTIPPTRFTNRP